jgi:esterase/lipase superfamily enzyme
VMPDTGQYGNYTNWYNDGAFGQPMWETYHIHQLLPWIDAHYPTVGKRSGRATAGLSMGGGGAMSYAARHPDLFVSASSFSGAVDTNSPTVQPVTEASGASDGAHTPGAIFGLRATEEVRWRAHNPWDLAGNLRGLKLTLRTGNGAPGGPGGDSGDPVEAEVHTESVNMHNQLVALHIPHVWDDYGPGGHAWYYWQRDLRETLPDIMKAFAHPPAAPSPFSFRAVEPLYYVYGWMVSVKRPALEFTELQRASRKGFRLLGSGTATVRTARYFKPHSSVRATIGKKKKTLRAGRYGRVTLQVPLGPGNPDQEYTPEAQATGTKVFTTKVALRGRRL